MLRAQFTTFDWFIKIMSELLFSIEQRKLLKINADLKISLDYDRTGTLFITS